VVVLCKGYNEVAFLCNGTNRHEIRENVNRCVLLNLSSGILKIFRYRGDLVPNAIFGRFEGSPCDSAASQGLRFSTSLSLPSVRGRVNDVPFPSRLFVRLTVLPLEAGASILGEMT